MKPVDPNNEQMTNIENHDIMENDVFVFPASFAQARLWFLYQLKPNDPAYNIPAAIRFNGSLQVATLKKSLNEIVRRHEVLRTTFTTIDGKPHQVIKPVLSIDMPVIDLRQFSNTKREIQVEQLAIEESLRPFNLSQGPLVRASLLQLDDDDFVFFLTVHHTVFDEWSSDIFWNELVEIYQAFSNGQSSSLSDLPIQYADFAHWQQQWFEGDVFETQMAFWRKQLDGNLPLLQLPTDKPRPAAQTFRGASLSVIMSKQLSEDIKDLGRNEGVTMFIALLAAFNLLLYRYTGQEDILVGSPIANRPRPELEELIGFFANTLVLRSDLSGNPSFRELLSRIREVALGAYSHQDLPFEKLVEELQPERDLSYNPIFQVMFDMENASTLPSGFANITMNMLEIERQTSHFDLTVSMGETDLGLRTTINYNTDLFNASTIKRMLGHLQTLLEEVITEPDRHLSEFQLLTEEERHQLLVEWNDTYVDFPKNKCIHQLFEEQVERTPDNIAVVFENEKLNYRELNKRANQVAHYLQQLGVGPDVLVAICMERSLELAVALMGILKAGGGYVPLDPTYPKDRIAFMLEDCNAPVLLTQSHLIVNLPEHKINRICLDSDQSNILNKSVENPESDSKPDKLVYIIYTSGSTGNPKGVMITHANLTNYCFAFKELSDIKVTDIVLQFSSISFDISVEEIFSTWLTGATLVLRTEDIIYSTQKFHQLIEKEKITVLDFPTAFWHEWVNELSSTSGLSIPESVKKVIVGGEKVSRTVFNKWLDLDTDHIRWINGYGPTEITIAVTFYEPLSDLNRIDSEIPIGRPGANYRLYVVDKYNNPVPIGVPGELLVGGAGVAKGYLNRPELTEEKFIQNPFSNDKKDRLYRTGDLVRYLDDGNIEFLGRIDRQVKLRGFRIELGEIESVFLQYPGIKDVVVIAREDNPGDKQLAAYIIPTQEFNQELSGLQDFLKEKLAAYMMPSAFIILESLPLTPNGKVDHKALPPPDNLHTDSETTYTAPQTDLEHSLVAIWQEVLNLEKVGIHDNFFKLGGHSLLAIRIMSRIREIIKMEVPLRSLFESPTIAELAKHIKTMLVTLKDIEFDTDIIDQNRQEIAL